MDTTQVTALPFKPWHSQERRVQNKSPSKEFLPSCALPSSDGICCPISFDEYSDDSDSDNECPNLPPTTAAEAATASEATEDEQLSIRSKRPWRTEVAECDRPLRPEVAEFVPRGFRATGTDDLDSGLQKPCWRRERSSCTIQADVPDTIVKGDEAVGAKPRPWLHSTPTTPEASPSPVNIAHASEQATPSTSEGSPSATGSIDGASSDSSVSCASRSCSPTPSLTPPLQEHGAEPMDLCTLLRWRPTLLPDSCPASLPTAAEIEPGTGSSSPSSSTPAWRRSLPAPTKPAMVLEVSEGSWMARQCARRHSQPAADTSTISNEDMVRTMKSILNKLTVEKFDKLSSQLVHCGIHSALHLEILIHEVFEKATTQHNFIDMYADLCVMLNQYKMIDDSKVNFKRMLLSCCQMSFEKHLTPPSGLVDRSDEERQAVELMYKMRMLGNIRFVGALFVRKMLASKVMLSIMQELMQDPTSETLESLAALLTVVGPTFDTPDWAYCATLNAVFVQVAELTTKTTIPQRVRCLLKDVLDLRTLGWHDRRPKKSESPLKLQDVAAMDM